MRAIAAVLAVLLAPACRPATESSPPILRGPAPSASAMSTPLPSSSAASSSPPSATVAATVAVAPPSASCLAALAQLESAADAIAGSKYCQQAKAGLAKLRAAPPLGDVALSREVEAHQPLVARRRLALERIATRLVPCDL